MISCVHVKSTLAGSQLIMGWEIELLGGKRLACAWRTKSFDHTPVSTILDSQQTSSNLMNFALQILDQFKLCPVYTARLFSGALLKVDGFCCIYFCWILLSILFRLFKILQERRNMTKLVSLDSSNCLLSFSGLLGLQSFEHLPYLVCSMPQCPQPYFSALAKFEERSRALQYVTLNHFEHELCLHCIYCINYQSWCTL